MSNRVTHKEYGVGQIIPSTEIVGETGLVEQVDILFEDKIVQSVDVENLTEVSADLLKRYHAAASKQINDIASKRGRKSAKDLKTVTKRNNGKFAAGEILHKKNEEEIAQEIENHKNRLEHLHKHIPTILSAHGYHKVTEHPRQGSVYLKVHDGAVSTIVHHHPNSIEGKRSPSHILSHTNSTGWQSSNDRHHADDVLSMWSMRHDPEEEKKKKMISNAHNFLNDVDERVKKHVERD